MTLPSRLRRLFTGAAATTVAAALGALLPPGAARAMDDAPSPWDMTDLDPSLADTAGSDSLLEVMFVVVACYVGLMVLYLWLASMIDEESDSTVNGRPNSFEDPQQHQSPAPSQQQLQPPTDPLPPSYPKYMHANVRSVREPKRGHALVAPSFEESPGSYVDGLAGVKAVLARQAADYVAGQVRACGSVVRRKLYLRRLAARETGRMPTTTSNSSKRQEPDIALLLSEPAALEVLVDRCLDGVPPEMLSDEGSDETLVRSICGMVARRLAAAEVGELVRSMQAAEKQRQVRQQGDRAFGAELW